MDNMAYRDDTVYNISTKDFRNGNYRDDMAISSPKSIATDYDVDDDVADDGLEKVPFIDDLDHRLIDFHEPTNVSFEKIFKEPEFYQRYNCGRQVGTFINNYMGAVYTFVQSGVFYGLALFFGFILSALWGLLFGILHFFLVWFYQPLMKILFVFIRMFGVVSRAIIRATFDPWFQSIGMMASQMRGRFSLKVNGMDKLGRVIEV